MRKSIVAAAILTAVLGSGAAFAGHATDTIKSLDAATRTVTLGDGTVVHFDGAQDKADMLAGFRPGDKVTVIWNMSGDRHEGLAISADYSGAVSGKISAIEGSGKSFTLEGGKVYSLLDNSPIKLGEFKVGDEVKVVPVSQDGSLTALAMASQASTDMTGNIRSVDTGMKTVTLENGMVVHFDNDTHAMLDDYRAGDAVHITSFPSGGEIWGTSISPAS